MNKIAIVLAVCAIVSGCATSQQQIDSHAPALNGWVGAPVAEFVEVQGPPKAVVEQGDHQVYTFQAAKTKSVSHVTGSCKPTNFNEPVDEYGQPGGCRTGTRPWYSVRYTCAYGLVVRDDVITDWSMTGNNCRMMTVQGRPSITR